MNFYNINNNNSQSHAQIMQAQFSLMKAKELLSFVTHTLNSVTSLGSEVFPRADYIWERKIFNQKIGKICLCDAFFLFNTNLVFGNPAFVRQERRNNETHFNLCKFHHFRHMPLCPTP